MQDAFGDAALAELRQVEAGAEVVAFAAEHDRARGLGQVDERGVQLRDQRSLMALRLAGRFRRTCMTAPRVLDAQQVEPGSQRAGGGDGGISLHWLILVNKKQRLPRDFPLCGSA